MRIGTSISADGQGSAVAVPELNRGRSQDYNFYAWGTFGGGTLVVQASIDGTNWFNIPNVSFTADGMVIVQGLRCTSLRYSLAGATGPDLNVEAK